VGGEVVSIHGDFDPEAVGTPLPPEADFTTVQFHHFTGDG